MIDQQAWTHRLPCGPPIHPIARASIRSLHLRHFSGILQADGYAGFHHLYEGGRIIEAACWAHVRRKFYDIQVATSSAIADEAIERIGALYGIEREVRGKPAELRCEVRNQVPLRP